MHLFVFNFINFLAYLANSYSNQGNYFDLQKEIMAGYGQHNPTNLDMLNNDISEFIKINTQNFQNINNNFTIYDPDAKLILEQGSMKLWDYGYNLPKAECNLLIIPSLVNKAYIFDLEKNNSFINELLAQNIRPYLLSWNNPSKEELGYDIRDYIEKHIIHAVKTINEPINIMGYCMGGIFTILLDSYNIDLIKKNIILTTPWDFNYILKNNDVQLRANLAHEVRRLLKNFQLPYIPSTFISSMIAYWQFETIFKKFSKYKNMLNFQLEQWAFDGIDMTLPMFERLFIDFVIHNKLHEERLELNGKEISLDNLNNKTLSITAQKDRIISKKASEPILKNKNFNHLSYNTSHTGIIIDPKIRVNLINDIKLWILLDG